MLFVLSGRWSPTRIFDLGPPTPALRPGTWAAVALLLIMLVPVAGRRGSNANQLVVSAVTTLSLAFLGYMIMTTAWTPDASYAASKAYELATLWIAVLGLYLGLSTLNPTTLNGAIWQWILIITGILATIALFSTFGAYQRVAVLGGGPNVFGRNMGLLAIACLSRVLRSSRPLAWSAALAIACLLVVLSGSRGAMIAASLGLVAALLWARARPARLVVLFALGLPFAMLLISYSSIGSQAVEIFNFRVGHLLVEQGYTAGREDTLRRAFELGIRHPVFGVGLAGFADAGGVKYPHNVFLEAFCEGGSVGLLLLSALVISAAWIVLRGGRRWDPATVGAAVLLLIASQFSGDLYDTRGLFIFLILAAATRDPIPRRRASTARRLHSGGKARERLQTHARASGAPRLTATPAHV